MYINNQHFDKLYIIPFVLTLFISFMIETESLTSLPGYHVIKYIIYSICFLLFILKIILDHKSTFLLIISFIFITCSFLISIRSKNTMIPLIILAIISAKDVSYLRIVKSYVITISTLTSIVIILSLLKLTPNIQSVKNGILRNSFGFNYPLALSGFVLFTCIAFCIYNHNDISWKDIILIFIVLMLNYHFTLAQMNLYGSFLLIIILIIYKLKRKILHIFPLGLLWLSLLFMSFMTFYFASNYDPSNNFYAKLNKLFVGRISLSNYAINQFHVNLFGQFIKENPTGNNIGDIQTDLLSYFYIDQSMIKILLSFGIIITLFIIIFYSYRMLQLHLHNLDFLVALFAIIILCAFSDDKFFELCYNPFLPILFADMSDFRPIKK